MNSSLVSTVFLHVVQFLEMFLYLFLNSLVGLWILFVHFLGLVFLFSCFLCSDIILQWTLRKGIKDIESLEYCVLRKHSTLYEMIIWNIMYTSILTHIIDLNIIKHVNIKTFAGYLLNTIRRSTLNG